MSYPSIESIAFSDPERPVHHRRSSKFKEGSEHASEQSEITDTYLLTVLSEMDKYEEKRVSMNFNESSRGHKASASNSSVESFASSSTNLTSGTRINPNLPPVVGKRSVSFGQPKRRDSRRGSQFSTSAGEASQRVLHDTCHDAWYEVKKGVVEKLRNWTSVKDEKVVKPYLGSRT